MITKLMAFIAGLNCLKWFWTSLGMAQVDTVYDYRADHEIITQLEFYSNYHKGAEWSSLTARICLSKPIMPERSEFEPRSPTLKFTLYLENDIIELIGEVFRCGKVYSGASWIFGSSVVGQIIHMKLQSIPLITTRKSLEV